MIDLGRVLKELKVTGFVFHNSDVVGNPKTEKEFNSMFGKVTGVKDDTSIVSTNPSDFGVTWKQVSDKLNKLGYTSTRGGQNTSSTVCSTYFKIRKHFERQNIYHPPDLDDVELVWE